jgi:hypothetical protein
VKNGTPPPPFGAYRASGSTTAPQKLDLMGKMQLAEHFTDPSINQHRRKLLNLFFA